MDKMLGLALLGVAGYMIITGGAKDKIQPEPVALDFAKMWARPEITGTRPDIFNITIESPSGNGALIDTAKSIQTSNFAPSRHTLPALMPSGMTINTLGTAFDVSAVEQAGGQITIDPKTGIGTLIKIPYKPISITQRLPPTTTIGAFTV